MLKVGTTRVELDSTHAETCGEARNGSSMTCGEHFTTNSTSFNLQHHGLCTPHVYPCLTMIKASIKAQTQLFQGILEGFTIATIV